MVIFAYHPNVVSRPSSSAELGLGAYGLHTAAWFTGIPVHRLRNWLRDPRSGRKVHPLPSLLLPELAEARRREVLSFRDLQEIRVIDSLKQRGWSLQKIRATVAGARRHLDESHPLSSQRLKTDDLEVYWDRSEFDLGVMRVRDDQLVFEGVMRPFLRDLTFEQFAPVLWFPVRRAYGDDRPVLDPQRSFGHPIINGCSIRTEVLAKHAAAATAQQVADWYEIDVTDVVSAVRFEEYLGQHAA